MEELMRKLVGIGPVLPGTLETRQRPLKNSVGSSKRKDTGTYHVLSYSVKGHNSSMYVKKADYAAVASMTSNYENARELIVNLGLEMVMECRNNGVEDAAAAWRKRMSTILSDTRSTASDAKRIRTLEKSRDSWKVSSTNRTSVMAVQRVRIRDLQVSRDNWRGKALTARQMVKTHVAELETLKLKTCELEQSLEEVKKKLLQKRMPSRAKEPAIH